MHFFETKAIRQQVMSQTKKNIQPTRAIVRVTRTIVNQKNAA